MRNFRVAKPFWQYLSERGIRSSIIRMPTNFPPVECEGESLAGTGTPDLRARLALSRSNTDAPLQRSRAVPGGQIVKVSPEGHRVRMRRRTPCAKITR